MAKKKELIKSSEKRKSRYDQNAKWREVSDGKESAAKWDKGPKDKYEAVIAVTIMCY